MVTNALAAILILGANGNTNGGFSWSMVPYRGSVLSTKFGLVS
jgi:hypothetical protein